MFLTLRKCCACHEICTWPCESAAPATKPVLGLAKVLRLSRNLYLTLRKGCACHEIQALGKLNLAKVLRLPRTLHLTLRKCCALHLTLRKCCACQAIQPLRNLRVAVPMGPRSEPAPSPLRARSERAPNALRPGAANRLASSSPETPIHARGHAFCRFLTPTTLARIFSRVLVPSLHLSQRELAFN